MKNDKTKFLLCVLFFVVLAAISFRCIFGENMVFSASDMNIGRLAFKKNSLPELMTGFFTANQVLGREMYAFSLFHILLTLLPLSLVANMFYGVMLVAGSIAIVAYLRLWERSWLASVFGALIAFWINSILLATVGHTYKLEVLAFSAISLYLIEKSIRTSSVRHMIGYAVLGGLSIGIMMIEQQDVALLAGLFLGSYTIFRLVQAHGKAVKQWLIVLVPIGGVALLLSGNAVLRSYEKNIAGASQVQSGQEGKWNYITQWSAVPEEWPDLIALGWGGWSTGNPDGPYWGKLGRSAEWEATGQGFQNFKLNSVYFGIIPFLMGLFGLAVAIRERKSEDAKVVLFWSVAGLLGFWVAFGKYSLLYKFFYHLPLFGDIRAPIKLLDNFQICLGIVAAYGLDWLLVSGKRSKPAKVFWIASTGCAVLMLLEGFKLQAFPSHWLDKFAQMGYKPYAEILLSCMSKAWLHTGVLAFLCAGLVFAAWRGLRQSRWVAMGFILLLAVDSLILTTKHFKANDITAIKRGNDVINYLKAHQGSERAFFLDQTGIYNQWVASDGPYHGLNLFNIWQMPRMPAEYSNYLSIVGKSPIRLWQLSSVKYIAAPAAIMQQLKQDEQLGSMFQPVLNYQVPTQQGMRSDVLLEFSGTIPRFALFSGWDVVPVDEQCKTLISPEHNVLTTVLVDPASGLKSKAATSPYHRVDARLAENRATVSVQTKSTSILRFCQSYQPDWQVFLDGQPAQLLRLDYLSMGVQVPQGSHTVEFRCLNGLPATLFVSGVFIVSLCGAIILIGTKP